MANFDTDKFEPLGFTKRRLGECKIIQDSTLLSCADVERQVLPKERAWPQYKICPLYTSNDMVLEENYVKILFLNDKANVVPLFKYDDAQLQGNMSVW